MRLASFTKYGNRAASTRQRLLQYIPDLRQAGIEVTRHSLLSDAYVQSLATGGSYSRAAIAASYLRRMQQIALADADVIWIYAELFPYLPASFEKLAFRSGRPVVYDFDDAFFHSYDSARSPWVRKLLGGKLQPLLRGAAACCCGNTYLQDYASQFCETTILLPTVVDTDLYRPRPLEARKDEPVVIGWIGSPSTWSYMRPLLPLLSELVHKHNVTIHIVGAGAGALADAFPGLDLIEWTEENEVLDVQAMDIGIMPLPDEEWARGKSGYKLIQYMACGLPVVASPVGANREIVRAGEDGYFAATVDEWRHSLERLIEDPSSRYRMGDSGRRRIEANFSLQAHSGRLIELLKSVAT